MLYRVQYMAGFEWKDVPKLKAQAYERAAELSEVILPTRHPGHIFRMVAYS